MVDAFRLWGGALPPLLLLAACDSSSPGFGSELLQVRGVVREAGEPPAPPLSVGIQAWPDPGSGATDSIVAMTDATGQYTAELGPFPNGQIDSLHVRVTQNDCDAQITTELRQGRPSGAAELTLPALSLSYRLPPAQYGNGAEMCGAVLPSTAEFTVDRPILALWIDDVTDSVRGRWLLQHSASFGSDYGYFSGLAELDGATLQLRPTQPTPCTGLQLDLRVEDINSATLKPGTLTSDGTCLVPNTVVRFFQGAALPDPPPPGGG